MGRARVVSGAIPAVVDEAPEVVGIEIPSYEAKPCSVAKSFRESCSCTTAGSVPGLVAAICAAQV
jgi:hypothetical protein